MNCAFSRPFNLAANELDFPWGRSRKSIGERKNVAMKRLPSAMRAGLYTLAASFLWGTSFVAVKIGLADLDPLWFLFVRILVASLLLLPFFMRRWYWREYLGSPAVWLIGFACAMGYVLQYIGMVETSASAAAFLINMGIIFVALFSWMWLNEPFDWLKIVGIVLAVAGAVMLSGGMQWKSFAAGKLRGNILVLAAGLFWAVYTVGNKWILHRPGIRVVPLTALVLFVAAIWILPMAILWGEWPADINRNHLVVTGYMILFCTAAPFVLWTQGLRGVQPTVSAAILLMEPVFAAALSYFILQERLSFIEWVGAGVIFIAILLVSLSESILRRLRGHTQPSEVGSIIATKSEDQNAFPG